MSEVEEMDTSPDNHTIGMQNDFSKEMAQF